MAHINPSKGTPTFGKKGFEGFVLAFSKDDTHQGVLCTDLAQGHYSLRRVGAAYGRHTSGKYPKP